MSAQDLSQGAVYMSSRLGPLDVRTLSTVHAARALDALSREHGSAALDSPLGLALRARADLQGSEVESRAVPFGDTSGAVLRGERGRFVGAVRRSIYRKEG